MVEDAAGLVDAAVGCELGLAAIPLRERDAFLEALRGADDRAFGISYRKRPELHGYAVARLMTQETNAWVGLPSRIAASWSKFP